MYVLYCGTYAREAKAVALAESNEDPLAISPAGLGIGIMQQGRDWQLTYPPTDPAATWFSYFSGTSNAATLYQHAISGGPWHPAYQLACYATFCAKNKSLDMPGRLRLYHYGHEQGADDDGYVKNVMGFYDALVGW